MEAAILEFKARVAVKGTAKVLATKLEACFEPCESLSWAWQAKQQLASRVLKEIEEPRVSGQARFRRWLGGRSEEIRVGNHAQPVERTLQHGKWEWVLVATQCKAPGAVAWRNTELLVEELRTQVAELKGRLQQAQKRARGLANKNNFLKLQVNQLPGSDSDEEEDLAVARPEKVTGGVDVLHGKRFAEW